MNKTVFVNCCGVGGIKHLRHAAGENNLLHICLTLLSVLLFTSLLNMYINAVLCCATHHALDGEKKEQDLCF